MAPFRLILRGAERTEKDLFSETPAAVGIDGHWSDRDTRSAVFGNASQFLEPGAEQARRGPARRLTRHGDRRIFGSPPHPSRHPAPKNVRNGAPILSQFGEEPLPAPRSTCTTPHPNQPRQIPVRELE